jgi:hypothetical protein
MNLFSGEDDIDGVQRQKGKRCRVTTTSGTVTGEYIGVKFNDDNKS